MILCVNVASANHFQGNVYCDVDMDGAIDPQVDLALSGVGVDVLAQDAGDPDARATTDVNGYYAVALPWGAYTLYLDFNTLPLDAVLVYPASNGVSFPGSGELFTQDWLIDSEICHEPEPYCGDGILDPGEECDDGNDIDGDGCSANCTVETSGDGCTPGYWKNHMDKWGPTGLSTDDDFDATFGTDYFDPDITLGEAVWARGGGVKKIARHGTSALLNASHPAVLYPAGIADVIAAVQNGDVNALVDFNELSDECPAND